MRKNRICLNAVSRKIPDSLSEDRLMFSSAGAQPISLKSFRGLGFPNKHFATQKCFCIDENIACYNGVGSEKFTASELYRCPNLSYNEDVLRERSIA
mgnify:CR=1 FL=1